MRQMHFMVKEDKTMENKSKKTRNIIGIVLVVIIGLVVWSMISTQSKWKYGKLGLAEYEKGDYKEAIKYYTLGIESNPSNASLYNNRGLAHFKLKEYEKALSDYSKAVELKTDFAVAYCNRGLAHFKSAQVPKAIIDFTKAIELDPKHVDAYYNRGCSYSQSVHYHEYLFTSEVEDAFQRALADFDKALELDPGYALAFAGKGTAYHRHRDWDRANAEYARALKLKDKIVERWGRKALSAVVEGRGRNYLTLVELEKAASHYDEALELDPKYRRAISLGVSVYGRLRNYNKVVELHSKMIHLIENDPEFKDHAHGTGRPYAGRAEAHYLLGRYDRAIADCQKALSSGSAEGHGNSNAEVHRYLCKIYLKTGKEQDAKKELNKAITLYTGKTGSKIEKVAVSGYSGRGLCYLDIEEYDRAISDFEKVIALNTPFDIKKYTKSILGCKGYAYAHMNLGLAYWKMGKREKANEYLKKAIKVLDEGDRPYRSKEIRDALKTGDVAGLLK